MAKKRDEGHDETESVLSELEKEINAEYAKAEEEIQEKLDDYLRRFEVKDRLKKQAVLNGQITQAEYDQWRVGQIAIGERWEEMKDTIATDLTNTAEIAKSISYGHMPEVYAINHNYGTFQVEKESLVDTSYTLYDKQSVERLFKGGKFYHNPGKIVTNAINTGKQKAWDKRQVQSVMTQALLQGESIGKIATRLAKTVGDSDRKACIRNARTMTTGVENAGRTDSYKRAEKMGIKLMQEWLATLDSRTRHEHRMLDGQRVKVGEPFEVDGYKIEYPGDPSAEGHLIYNCRCTLVPVLSGFEVDSQDLSLRHDSNLEEETYEEWKEQKESRSDPITKQDSIEQTMKRKYNNEYREYAGQAPIYNGAEGYPEDTYNRKISFTDSDEDLKAVNPLYGTGNTKAYDTNCQRCVPTYLMRRKGFDVQALPRNYGHDKNKEFMMANAPHMIYRKADGTIPLPINTRRSTTFGKAEIENYMKDLDDGALCEVTISWINGGSHVFIAEKKDGKVRYIDPQKGLSDVSEYFTRIKKGSTYFWRIDDTTIDEEYLPIICKTV